MTIFELCKTPGILRAIYIAGVILEIVTIVIPIIIIITLMMSAGKLIVSGKQDELKGIVPSAVKKIIAGLVVFLIPSILEFAFSLVPEELPSFNVCIANANMDTIEYYEELQPVEFKVQNAENNPSDATVAAAREALQKVTAIAKEDDMVDYLQRISAAEVKASENKDILACQSKNGTYKNGYCFVPKLPEKPNNNGTNNGSDEDSGEFVGGTGGSGGMISIGQMNGEYDVVDTAISVEDYLNVVSSRRIAQNNDSSIYGGYCLAFSYIHAYSLFTGDTSKGAPDAIDYVYASKFKGYDNDNKDEVLKNVYNEISNGRPCLIQVNGNKAGTSRHYVTVVGVKKSVKNANDVTEDDLLIIDSWDGRLEGLGNNGARFMVTGAACKKKYSGYQMYYIK